MSHPETVDPLWMQELIRKAYDREATRFMQAGHASDQALEEAMWSVFNLRTNLAALYRAAQ